MSGLISIGQSGLAAAYTQLQVAGQNIANANTPGYVRQSAIQATATSQFTGVGWIGRGVNVSEIRRDYDAFLGNQVTQNQSFAGGDAVRSQMLGQLDKLFGNTENGLGVAMDEFRSALADVVNLPGDPSARQAAVSRAQSMAAQFRDTSDQLDRIGESVDYRLADAAAKLTDDLAAIADLNGQISAMNQAGRQPTQLLDQRDLLINSVAGRMQVSRHDMPDGSVTLLSANGAAMVIGGQPASVSTRQDPADASRSQVVVRVGGSDIGMSAASFGSGEVAGLLRFRDEDLASARARVGQLAAAVAGAYNEQQGQGVDANGNAGQDLFGIGSPQALAARTNVGDGELDVTVVEPSSLEAADYRLSFDGVEYQLENLVDGSRVNLPALPAQIRGLQLVMTTGAMTIGDSFTIRSASRLASEMRVTMNDGQGLATGYPSAVEMGPTNVGTVSVGRFSASAADPAAAEPVSIVFTSPTTYNVTGAGTGDPVGLTYTPGETISYNGWSVALQGTPVLGDTINVVPTVDPANDNRNARAMVGLADQPMVNGRSFNSAFSGLLLDVGTRTARSEASAANSQALLKNSEEVFAQSSGVNLDEEAARLLQYQQAYRASAQVISTANAMFDTILSVVQRA